jgi:hypothetical protein
MHAYNKIKTTAAVTIIVLFVLTSIFILTRNNVRPSVYASDQNTTVTTSHLMIQESIDLAKRYIDSLYKADYPNEVDKPNTATIAEYTAIPLSIRMNDGTIIRAGEDKKLFGIFSPITSIFSPITSISNIKNTKYLSSYDITFRRQQSLVWIEDIAVLHVEVNHNYQTGSAYGTKVTISQKSFQNIQPTPYADVYLGTGYIGKATPGKNGKILGSHDYSDNSNLNSRSIRYSERHNTQLGYEWYLANGDHTKAAKLYNNLIDEGYQVHKDIYSPLFGTDTTFADNYQYDSGPNGVYRDCYIEPAMTDISYQYHSKVCAFGVDFYVWFSKSNDWLIPTLWAIHLLNKYHSPDTEYYDGNSVWSPREVARFDETKWIKNIGIQLPDDKTVASSVRTAVFEELETILGYHYGDRISRAFADRAAHDLVLAQIKSDGTISEYDTSTQTTRSYQRTDDIGAFYTAWKQPFLFHTFIYVTTISPIKQVLEWLFNHPDESGDIKPSNAETTITSAQALRTYDCFKYVYNCANTPLISTSIPATIKAPTNVTSAIAKIAPANTPHVSSIPATIKDPEQ